MEVRAGIIGFGYMGHYHLDKARCVDGLKVVAAYDVEPQKLAQAKEAGLIAYERLEAFLADPGVDLVLVCTLNDVHAQLSIACLNAGKHVMCEKPVTMNSQELQEVLLAAQKNGRLFTAHQNRRWDVDYRMVKQAVDSGEIGRMT